MCLYFFWFLHPTVIWVQGKPGWQFLFQVHNWAESYNWSESAFLKVVSKKNKTTNQHFQQELSWIHPGLLRKMIGFYFFQSCFLKTHLLELLFSLSGHSTDALGTGHSKMDLSNNCLGHLKICLTIQMLLKPPGRWLITEFYFSESLYLILP